MIAFEFDRDGQVEGTCDMVTVENNGKRMGEEHKCDSDATVQFTEDGSTQKFCLEHGKMRVQSLIFNSKVWEVYTNP